MAQLVNENNKMMYKDSAVTDELLLRNTRLTPDYLDLKEKANHPVFVYGTLKKGFGLHRYLEGYPYLGRARPVTPSFEMYDTGGFPVIKKINSPRKGEVAHVSGEVYVVPPKIILELDRVENNGGMYLRQKTYFFLRDQQYKTQAGYAKPSIHAFIYVGNPDYWDFTRQWTVSPTEEEGQRYLVWDKKKEFGHGIPEIQCH